MKDEFIHERRKVQGEIELRVRALNSFIARFPDALMLAKQRVGDFPDEGLRSYKRSWMTFLEAPGEERAVLLNSEGVGGLQWPTLVQFSPFFTDPRWREHLTLERTIFMSERK